METLVGGLLGLVTATLLVVLSLEVFSGLADFDHDLGLRMRHFYVQRIANWSHGLHPDGADATAFVFLDLEAEPLLTDAANASATAACRALQLARTQCRAATPGAPPGASPGAPPGASPGASPGAANTQHMASCVDTALPSSCAAGRPVDRGLLAALVTSLRRSSARLIVLDVELSDEADQVPAAETSALRKALSADVGGAVPVIIVRPAQYDRFDEDSKVYVIRPGPAFALNSDTALATTGQVAPHGVMAAIALPAPGQPIRRYPRCYRSTGQDGGVFPSLPWLAANLLVGNAAEPAKAICGGAAQPPGGVSVDLYAAPYINYAIPSLRAHEDDSGDRDDFRLWSTYRQLSTHCLVSAFWSQKSPCGHTAAYANKVVVIGASSTTRRDRHATPIGNLAGAEVVINAIHSFVPALAAPDKSTTAAVVKKAGIVLVCLLPWFGFFCLRGYLRELIRPQGAANTQHGEAHGKAHEEAPKAPPLRSQLLVGVATLIAFCCTLAVAIGITMWFSLASFSVLVGVLAIGIEQYVEAVTKWVLHPSESFLKWVLRIPPKAGTH